MTAAPFLYNAQPQPVVGIDPAVALQILPPGAPHQTWLAVRRSGIGGSEVSTLVRLNRWSSEYELWLDKTGQLPLVDEQSEAAEMGSLLEPVVRDRFARVHDLTVRQVGTLRSVRWPWMLGNPDGLCSDGAGYEGKALDVDTPMLTTRGWSTMGNLQAGDEVFHPDGQPTRVVGAFNVMHGHDCYLVTTTDGRSVVADADHLWTVQDLRRKGHTWETLTTTQLIERGYRMVGVREAAYRLPKQKAIISKPVDLPVDPYLLGAWLGDGSTGRPILTIGDQDLDETVKHLNEVGVNTTARRDHTAWSVYLTVGKPGAFKDHLRDLGVWSRKRIPDLYLTAGTEQRLSLLQGLLDTDGSISARGQVEFSSCQRELADGVLFLVRSLGWRGNEAHVGETTLNGRRMKPRWRVRFTPEQGDPIPFRLTRKIARIHVASARGQNRRRPTIKSIVQVASRPVRCIKVDREDGLFLAGRELIPTHNTCSVFMAHEWKHGQVADHAELQAQWGMAVTGLTGWWVACLIAGQRNEYRYVERNDRLINLLVDISHRFWHDHVLAGVEPTADGTPAATQTLLDRYPTAGDNAVEIDEHTAAALVAEKTEAAEAEKDAHEAHEAVKNRARQLIGDGDRLVCGDDEIATWRQIDALNLKRLTVDHPALVDQYTRLATVERFDLTTFKQDHPDLYAQYRQRQLRFLG